MKRPLFVLLVGLGTLAVARADDSEISYGGSPSMLRGTSQIAMVSEVVLLDIGPTTVKTDCQFVFKNTGGATTIRMGFPDGDSARDEEMDETKPPYESAFSSFASFVDGRPVPTTLVKGKEWLWRVKEVRFPAHAVRRVREVYTTEVGGSVAGKKPVATAYYVLQTGASWHGPIGRMEIIARFRRAKNAHPQPGKKFQNVRAVSHKALGNEAFDAGNWMKADEEVVVYEGPGTPEIEHNVLRWVRTNIRPTDKDDVFLTFKPAK